MTVASRPPIVSVILPTHDRAATLERSVRSILVQALAELEVIVVDDGSGDNTPDVVATIDDARVVYLRHGERLGANAARNTGLRAARGRYVGFQDSDDTWRPEKLREQMHAMTSDRDNVAIVASAIEVRHDGRAQRRPVAGAMPFRVPPCRVFVDSPFGLPGLLFRSEILHKIGGFDERMRRLQDWELILRAASFGAAIRFIDRVHVDANALAGGISDDREALLHAHRRILRVHGPAFEACGRQAIAAQWLRVAHLMAMSGRVRRGRILAKAARRHVPSARSFAQEASTYLGSAGYRAVFSAFSAIRG